MKDKHIRAYVETAHVFAKCSPAVRLKVGAVLVKDNNIISVGYNALPAHMSGLCEYTNDNGELVTRLELTHAEENALRSLLKTHNTPVGATLFCTHSCCLPCAIKIVDAGIKTVYYEKMYRSDEGLNHLIENGIEVIHYQREL